MTTQQTRTGMTQNLASAVSYALGPITGIAFLFLEPDNRAVRFHAMQSLIVFGALFLLQSALVFVPAIGLLALKILSPVTLVLWIALMVRAYQGKGLQLPVAGAMAEAQVARMSA